MASEYSTRRSRWSLTTSVLMIGLISLLQAGCDSGPSGSFAPAIIASVFPVQNSETALVTTDVIVFFGTDMDETTIDETTFTLTEAGGAQITATVTYDAATRSATLDPAADLVSGASYTATISAAVRDAAGSAPLPGDFVWSFTVSQATELVSKNASGVVGNDVSSRSAIDGTGRYVAFVSEGTNLATTPTTLNRSHIYRKDTLIGEVLLASSTDAGLEANNNCSSPRISVDGRYVVFTSFANNLSAIATGNTRQVYIKDMDTGDVSLVSRDTSGIFVANNVAANPDVSNDGRYVVFESAASNLSLLPNNGLTQIYRKDMTDDSIETISRNTSQSAGALGNSNRPRMSSDARFIVFDSNAGSDIVVGANGIRHVYLVDIENPDVTEQISVDSSGVQGNGASLNADISDDGVFIVFESIATNLAAGDSNGGLSDIFRRNRTSPGSTRLVSTPDNVSSGSNGSFNASISSDGNYVSFESESTNFATETVPGLNDIFVRNFSTEPTVTLDKINLSQQGFEATDNSTRAAISADGRYVSFDSRFNYDVTDTNTIDDVFQSRNSSFQ